MKFDEWRRRRDGMLPFPPRKRETVADILNSHHGLCYLKVSDVALDSGDRFWLRRSAFFEEQPPFLSRLASWVPVSGFSHGGKVHINSDVDWGDIEVIPEPDAAEWARVYKIGE